MSLSGSDFDWIRMLVRRSSAIVIEDGKEYLAESKIGPVARAHGFDSIAHLVQKMRLEPDEKICRAIVEAMAIGETYFFRDPQAFQFLRTEMLPEVIERCSSTKRLRIWCGASSTGQEPYSVAMILAEHFDGNPALSGWDAKVVATDISFEALSRAREGRYSQQEVNRGLPARMLVRHFHRVGLEWRLNDDVRQRVEFEHLNLVEGWRKPVRFNLILMRNVLIYFDVETKRGILERVAQDLEPGGCILFGSAETVNLLDARFEALSGAKSMWCRVRR
ncbi:MAG: protein-glutamate O-methyltransferase CheR [Deltaproteobacteria bacterium]|nr:protein-glutamate O-methyltransferase CheR [Deltaproteobacteria bacterium]